MVDPNLFSRLDEMGLEAVKFDLAMGKVGRNNPDHYNAVLSWVKSKEDAAAAEAEARAETREEAMLSTARDANVIAEKALLKASRANTIAISAMILSAATAIIVAVIQFISQKPSP